MHFHVLTLFPDLFGPYFSTSILGRAIKKGLIQISCYSLRDYATDRSRSVDDRPYGGGSGMIFLPEVVVSAVREIKKKAPIARVILMSPRGRLFSDEGARELMSLGKSPASAILLICGRYEGVDQRAIDLVVDEEISVGDYVLTGGELPAMVIMDAVSRLIPGVVGNREGPEKESHRVGLLEHPHYTRPQVFEGISVPEVLLSGNHKEIDQWRRDKSLEVTKKNRPDIIKKLKCPPST